MGTKISHTKITYVKKFFCPYFIRYCHVTTTKQCFCSSSVIAFLPILQTYGIFLDFMPQNPQRLQFPYKKHPNKVWIQREG